MRLVWARTNLDRGGSLAISPARLPSQSYRDSVVHYIRHSYYPVIFRGGSLSKVDIAVDWFGLSTKRLVSSFVCNLNRIGPSLRWWCFCCKLVTRAASISGFIANIIISERSATAPPCLFLHLDNVRADPCYRSRTTCGSQSDMSSFRTQRCRDSVIVSCNPLIQSFVRWFCTRFRRSLVSTLLNGVCERSSLSREQWRGPSLSHPVTLKLLPGSVMVNAVACETLLDSPHLNRRLGVIRGSDGRKSDLVVVETIHSCGRSDQAATPTVFHLMDVVGCRPNIDSSWPRAPKWSVEAIDDKLAPDCA